MQYKLYGNTGKRVSRLGFGAMRLPFDDPEASVALLRLGLELGINYIDTAHGYGGEGRSEIYVGRAIAGCRDRVFIASKNPLHDETVEGWWERLETSLTRLQTDHIDFYKVVHSLNWDTYCRVYEPTLIREALRAKEQGLINHIVFSCHDTPENILKLVETGVFEGLLLQYNLLDRRNEEVIQRAGELQMGVEVMGPVGGGRLGMASEQLHQALPSVERTPELALRFVLSNPHVTIAFSGMSDEQQVRENCETVSRNDTLSAADSQTIHEMLIVNQKLAELYCTGCGYCMPCPQNVGIPQAFAAMNMHRVWGLTEPAKQMYARLGTEHPEGLLQADACVECRLCEEKCPQNIAIIAQLKETHEALACPAS